MKILLLIAPYNPCEYYPDYQAKPSKLALNKNIGLIPGATTPLGPLYIAAVLKNAGHDVKLIDGIFYSWEDVEKAVKNERPQVAGISVTAFGFDRTMRLTALIKNINPKIHTIIGGPFPDAMQEKCLEEDPNLDAVSIGDGEYIMRDFCNAIENCNDLSKVKGIIWRDGTGKIIKNPPCSFIENLDELPFPARELVEVKRYSPAIGHYKKLPNATIIGSRGCKGQCIFCHTKIFPGLYTRFRRPELVVDEMEELIKKYDIKDFLFWDNNITEDKERTVKFCEDIIKRKLNIVWSGNTRADSIDKNLAILMKKSGCWKLLIGVESGTQKSLDILNKGETVEQIEKAVGWIKKAGIDVFATFIFGIPGETYQDALKTIDLAIKLEPDVAKFFTLSINPGSIISTKFQEYGTMDTTSYAQCFQGEGFVPYSMSREELHKVIAKAYRRFYMRPYFILRRISKIRSIEDIKQNMRGFLAFSKVPD
ncbi:MAG: cobalamin B12-binding domain-containing protein [Candidatus Firestonebacteria bacterium]|nr:cobalamin B12-binding domain-containing protein [Candidatus Firestonebacteria bacterium]